MNVCSYKPLKLTYATALIIFIKTHAIRWVKYIAVDSHVVKPMAKKVVGVVANITNVEKKPVTVTTASIDGHLVTKGFNCIESGFRHGHYKL